MFKEVLTIFYAVAVISEATILKTRPYVHEDEFRIPNDLSLRSTDELATKWATHIMEFFSLIDLEKVFTTAVPYLTDPEVLTLVKFMLSPQFKELIWELETLDEFKEAFAFLESKGYDMESAMTFVNTALNLPPFEKPNYVLRNGRGLSGFFEALVATLPLDDMKTLFEIKLQTVPELAELFETINSPEFMDIMRRMRKNPKFMDMKTIFEGYGFDFNFLCAMAKEIFGQYYQGVFCE